MDRLIWSFTLAHPVRALSWARESGHLLIRDDNQTLSLLNAQGALQGQTHLDGLTTAALADDGSVIVAASNSGRIWWLNLDLTVRTQQQVAAPALAIAVDSFGQYLALADKRGLLHFFDALGQPLGPVSCPRPLHHLAFAPAAAQLAAAADLGFVGVLDLNTAQWLWSDRPVSHVGSVAVGARGEPVFLACFSDGVRRYGAGGASRRTIKLPIPCSLVATSFAGERGIAAGAGHAILAFDPKDDLSHTIELEHTPTALGLSPTGEQIVCALSDYRVLCATAPWA